MYLCFTTEIFVCVGRGDRDDKQRASAADHHMTKSADRIRGDRSPDRRSNQSEHSGRPASARDSSSSYDSHSGRAADHTAGERRGGPPLSVCSLARVYTV